MIDTVKKAYPIPLLCAVMEVSRSVYYFWKKGANQQENKNFQKMLTKHQMISNLSRKGNCWDNAVAESFLGSLKTERVSFSNYTTRDAARKDIVDYIERFYNSGVIHIWVT